MLARELSNLRAYMQQNGIMFCFSGFMTEDVLSGIGSALKKKLEIEDADLQTSRGLFSIFVELVQNVIRYSAEKEIRQNKPQLLDLRYGVLTVGRTDDEYFVACGNLITKADGERLGRDLAHLKALDRDGLKALYKETLKGEVPEGSKGAGVGFIEIARRAKRGFEYDFHPVEDDRCFFTIKAFI